MDESIFLHDALVRRKMWTAEGIRPVVKITGLHQRTCVLGALYRWKEILSSVFYLSSIETFLKYLKELQRKFGKIILFIDRARQHHHESKMIRTYLTERNDVLSCIFSKRITRIQCCRRMLETGKV